MSGCLVAGRLISPQDTRVAGANAVAILSYDYWQTRFSGDQNIVGQTIRLNSYPMTVIGVTQPGFYGVDLGYSPQVMVPVTMKKWMTPNWDDLEQRRTRALLRMFSCRKRAASCASAHGCVPGASGAARAAGQHIGVILSRSVAQAKSLV